MPTPQIVGSMIPLTYLVMFAVESRWPARPFPPRRAWGWIGMLFLMLNGIVSSVVPLLIDPKWLAAHRWLDGVRLGTAGGALVGHAVLSGVAYAFHRAMHGLPLLWRLTHQLHHSPQRVDLVGSVFFHPTEMVLLTLLHLFVTVIVLGLDPLAAAFVGYIATFCGMFQHWNINTPRWLGVLIQRPEAHCEHHRKNVHAHNYADFPVWDILFGTFFNPAHFEGDCGFEAPADMRVGAMLAFRDVNETVYDPASRGGTSGAANA